MAVFLSKFKGPGTKTARVNSIRVAKSVINFLKYLTGGCSLSDVIMSNRFLCVGLASTTPYSLYTVSCQLTTYFLKKYFVFIQNIQKPVTTEVLFPII